FVRRSGSQRWTRAARIEGLFCFPAPEWYYIHDGERVGPVTVGRLRRRTRRGQIRPDDLVWKPGLRNWKPAAQIVGLFPRRDPVTPATQVPARGPNPARPGGGPPARREEHGPPRSPSRLWLLASVAPIVLAVWIGRQGRKLEPKMQAPPAPVEILAGP